MELFSIITTSLRFLTFGHEIAHNLGAQHNIELKKNTVFPYGHGHRFGSYKSIMSYNKSHTRVNYFSNPNVIHPKSGKATGIAGISNNARVLTQNRFTVSNYYKDTGTCDEQPGSAKTNSFK